jgi:hypothetical protein
MLTLFLVVAGVLILFEILAARISTVSKHIFSSLLLQKLL